VTVPVGAKTVSKEAVVAWVLLIVAGLLEVGWATLLPATNGLRALLPTAGFLALLAGSMLLLSTATRTIPIGTAYGVWVGVGAVGALAVGVLWHGEAASPGRIVFAALLVVAIIGLKVTAGH
jgi:quaternary ammonium compound-resistance protein SugE